MGTLQAIEKDVELLNNQPIFKVQCSLDHTQLNLANGASGKLQKGLTVTALFLRISDFDMELELRFSKIFLHVFSMQK